MPDRQRLIGLLQQRAQLLRPSEDLIDRALRRCIRHQLRFAKKQGVSPTPLAVTVLQASAPAVAAPPDERSAAAIGAATEALADGGTATRIARAGAVTPAAAMALTEPEPDEQPPSPSARSSASRQALLPPGRDIAGYRIEGLIGSGGMGQVYRALQVSMNRPVALKILSPRLAANPRFRDRFLREARAAGRLHHPNLIAVHDVGEADGMMFFSMEIVEGTSVKEVINELGTLPVERALDIARQALRALGYAHEHGIVHRDIKPDNLMLTTSGLVKVADLGLSKVDQPLEDSFTTQAGTMMGTPYYMPPEQGRDAHRADARADLYAIGATLYHMVCGKVPFEGETPVAILINASTQPLLFPEPGPDAALRRLIEALMAKKPADRPADSGEAVALIDRLRAPGGAPPPAGAPRNSERMRSARVSNRHYVPGSTRRRRRRRPSAALAAVAAAVAVAGVVVFIIGGRADDAERRARDLAGRHEYQSALDLLGHRRRGEAGALADQVARDWDAWAEPQAAEQLAAADRALAAGDGTAAGSNITGIPDQWRSPRVRAAMAERERAIARLGDQRLDAPGGVVVHWWQNALDGQDGVEAHGAGFHGDGAADLGGAPRGANGALPIALRVRLAGAPARSGDRWTMLLGANRRLTVDTDGLLLQEGERPSRLLASPDRAGWLAFALEREDDGWRLRVGAAVLRLADGGQARPALQWRLADGVKAEVELGSGR